MEGMVVGNGLGYTGKIQLLGVVLGTLKLCDYLVMFQYRFNGLIM